MIGTVLTTGSFLMLTTLTCDGIFPMAVSAGGSMFNSAGVFTWSSSTDGCTGMV